ncbi:MAG: hypothetical protein KAS66_13285 [Candidatus Omnitrophica bacterium]|nr:hypothetical protein [Candidatus Omnitrophota bacterium]
MSHLLESLFIMDGDNIRPVVDGKKIQSRGAAGGGNEVDISHDNSSEAIVHSAENMLIHAALGQISFRGGANITTLLLENGSNVGIGYIRGDTNKGQLLYAVDDDGGNQFVFTNSLNINMDHDIALRDDPLLAIFSDTDPDTDNTQNILFWHDKTHGNCQVNKGEMNFDIYDGLLNIKRRSDANDVLILGHDGIDGKVNTQTGQLKLRAASDVVIKVGTAAINGAMATDELTFHRDGSNLYVNAYNGSAWKSVLIADLN